MHFVLDVFNVQQVQRSCVSYFCHCTDKISAQINLGKEGFYLGSQFEDKVHHGGN